MASQERGELISVYCGTYTKTTTPRCISAPLVERGADDKRDEATRIPQRTDPERAVMECSPLRLATPRRCLCSQTTGAVSPSSYLALG